MFYSSKVSGLESFRSDNQGELDNWASELNSLEMAFSICMDSIIRTGLAKLPHSLATQHL